MPFEPEMMRACILDAFRRQPGTQYRNLQLAVAAVAHERGLPVAYRGSPVLDDGRDIRRFRETVWALIIEGVLTVGMDDYNPSWPFLSLTEYGEECIRAGQITPHDPDGYLAALASVALLDATEERYLPQALEAHRRNLPDAAAVMLGAASEHLVALVAEAIEQTDPTVAATMRKRLDGPALPLLGEVHAYFEQRRPKLPRDLKETLDTTFLGIANLIRITRNDAGHPALSPVTRDQALVNLRLYPVYREWVHGAIRRLPL